MTRESQRSRLRSAMERVDSTASEVIAQAEWLSAATSTNDRRTTRRQLLSAARSSGNATQALSRVRK